MSEEKLFVGPGEKLIIPHSWTKYEEKNCPICKDIKAREKRGEYVADYEYRGPHGTYKRFEVPFGSYYTLKPLKITRQATLKEIQSAINAQSLSNSNSSS